ncbi:PDDEXK nuclease domain-containing protein [Sinorhizobium medicae]|nr:PDDEXK nuclease domain-containing protein [Sinorhizobium medicae]
MSHHLRLRCFVTVELKIENFKPELTGGLKAASLTSIGEVSTAGRRPE